MTNDEIELLLLEWAKARGGYITEQNIESITARLEEHFLDPDTTTLEQARRVLGLPVIITPRLWRGG